MSRRHVALAAVACLAASASAAAAQPRTPPPPWTASSSADPSASAPATACITPAGCDGSGPTPCSSNTRRLPGHQLAAIDSLWVRRGHGAVGALVGAVILGVPAAAIGPELACGRSGVRFQYGERVQFFVFGALPGALVGALIGSAIPSWETFFP